MNDEPIILKINASDLTFSNVEELEKLNLPKELYETSKQILDNHNRDARILHKYSFLLISLFFTGFLLIFFLFQCYFFPSLMEYIWIFVLLICIGFGASLIFSETRKQTLVERTLLDLVEKSFEVLIINKDIQVVKMLSDSKGPDKVESSGFCG